MSKELQGEYTFAQLYCLCRGQYPNIAVVSSYPSNYYMTQSFDPNKEIIIRYSSRLSLHFHVPFTSVFFNFIRGISWSSRVILRVLHASRTWHAVRKSDFVCCMQVSVHILRMYVSLQTEYQTCE